MAADTAKISERLKTLVRQANNLKYRANHARTNAQLHATMKNCQETARSESQEADRLDSEATITMDTAREIALAMDMMRELEILITAHPM